MVFLAKVVQPFIHCHHSRIEDVSNSPRELGPNFIRIDKIFARPRGKWRQNGCVLVITIEWENIFIFSLKLQFVFFAGIFHRIDSFAKAIPNLRISRCLLFWSGFVSGKWTFQVRYLSLYRGHWRCSSRHLLVSSNVRACRCRYFCMRMVRLCKSFCCKQNRKPPTMRKKYILGFHVFCFMKKKNHSPTPPIFVASPLLIFFLLFGETKFEHVNFILPTV